MALAIADADAHASEADYLRAIERDFRVTLEAGLWRRVRAMGRDAAFAEAEEIVDLRPYDPSLPTNLASLCATMDVGKAVKGLDVTLLDAPFGHGYVLGDCPVPVVDIGRGFDVPLSKGLALRAMPPATAGRQAWARRTATAREVTDINDGQRARARSVVIWPAL
ncbi:hypothetical protein [Methylobacterium organophilum]|uniref:Uncharacterized protein n=1 Tax=Methylobacterium organophilum TaxID=410 RepID=A0ABQ4TAS5_METOR|nr:hypothetical protein [Methylobacterium organophilum]GJE28782.1 hypothetical protein LKMONMHP_3656 [Methylobacterium organophilum]